MKGTKTALCAKVSAISLRGKIRERILLQLIALFLTLPRRINFTQLTKLGERNEATYHNWFKQDLDLVDFNRQLIDAHGSGSHFVIFDPSFISKSGKITPNRGSFWSGGAGKSKQGLEMSAFAVADIQQHTAYHLTSTFTTPSHELKKEGKTLMDYYVNQVKINELHIRHFGNLIVADTYFGVSTFVLPVLKMGIHVISCLKSNASLFYLPPPPTTNKTPVGRPRKKDGKIDWNNLDNQRLPIVYQDSEKIIRSAKVYVKSLLMTVVLVAVDYLKADGTLQTRKLYFSTDPQHDWLFVTDCYGCRFQIEFLFRDAKQFAGLMHCQSTDETKLLNHINLSLTSVSVAKATHWEKDKPFSMQEIKSYYHNLKMVELISEALGLDTNSIKNNPKIISILKSNSYDAMAA